MPPSVVTSTRPSLVPTQIVFGAPIPTTSERSTPPAVRSPEIGDHDPPALPLRHTRYVPMYIVPGTCGSETSGPFDQSTRSPMPDQPPVTSPRYEPVFVHL